MLLIVIASLNRALKIIGPGRFYKIYLYKESYRNSAIIIHAYFLKLNGFCGCNCVVMLVKANKDNPHHERIFKSKLLIGY